ncbi:DUF4232 domain-containing protein [Streptomyces sp. MAR4 CNX-425]|uniref:DUF4232 domain-containing protein n=1 Tax=Streptomyces sp. MAR4 CNX-425 TaxID=3406343 RepID=UPI003B50E9C5
MTRQPGRARTRIALAALAAAGLLAAGCGTDSDDADTAPAGGAQPRQAERAGGDESAQHGDRAEQDAPAQDGDAAEQAAEGGKDDAAEDGAAEDNAADGADDGADIEPLRAEPKAAAGSGAAPWCRTDDLSASVRPLNSAAGNRYAALVLTNDSDSDCRTRGWTGLQLVRENGANVPTQVVRDDSRAPAMLTLSPGSAAWSRLHWTVVASGSDDTTGACRPRPAELEVIPPDTYHHTDASWRLGEVCDAGRIDALPLAKGDGPAR